MAKKDKGKAKKTDPILSSFSKLGNYNFKEQSEEHRAKMRKLAEEMLDDGYIPDEIIDVGDWILNELSLAQILGEEEIDNKELVKEKKNAKPKEKGTAKKANSKPTKPAKDKPKGKSKDKSKGKGKKK